MRRTVGAVLATVAVVLAPRTAVVTAVQAPARPAIESGDAAYWCPMHPDQRANAPGTCPVCRMPLVKMPPAKFATYPVDLRATPTTNGVRLRLSVQAPVSKRVVRNFTVVHERPMHLFVVGDGLRFFAHEHPVQQPDGVFMLDLALPRPGPYMAVAEFLPEGGTAQLFQQIFTTGATIDSAPAPAVDVTPKIVDGMRVTLDLSRLKAGQTSTLAPRVEDAASGAEISDLEPYLGARAHMLIVGADLTEAIHGHPEDDRTPGLTFTPLIPRAGRYKLWIQVQRRGVVSTIPFVIEATPGASYRDNVSWMVQRVSDRSRESDDSSRGRASQ